MKGARSCRTMLHSPDGLTPPWAWSRAAASNGVRNTPRRLEAEAAATAAGTLPRATPTKAMELWMVEGRQPRNTMPAASGGGVIQAGRAAIPRQSRGNRPKVEASTSRCSRQWVRPPITASRDSRAPCRKNTTAMAALVTQPRVVATSPRAGATEARAATARIRTRYQSGLRRASSPGRAPLTRRPGRTAAAPPARCAPRRSRDPAGGSDSRR